MSISPVNETLIKSITDIKYCFYINLASRPDRKIHIESQLKGIGLNPIRFNAIKLKNGRVGCSMSHLKCLQIAKNNKWPYVMICEDDLLILNNETFIDRVNNFFINHGDNSIDNKWDVLLLAGNNVPPHRKIDETCIQVSHCQTTTGYIVKSNYYDTLINNIREGIENLMKTPDQHIIYAIDKYWIKLQKQHKWYLLAPIVAVQREDYSDIEERKTNYENIMKDLDKPHFVHQQQHMIQKHNGISSILSNIPSMTPARTAASETPTPLSLLLKR
jgi:GR25 family glycosyltransferase involved in LPS biosynthesis